METVALTAALGAVAQETVALSRETWSAGGTVTYRDRPEQCAVIVALAQPVLDHLAFLGGHLAEEIDQALAAVPLPNCEDGTASAATLRQEVVMLLAPLLAEALLSPGLEVDGYHVDEAFPARIREAAAEILASATGPDELTDCLRAHAQAKTAPGPVEAQALVQRFPGRVNIIHRPRQVPMFVVHQDGSATIWLPLAGQRAAA